LEAQSSEPRRLKGSVRLEAALHASHASDDSRASQRAWRVLGKICEVSTELRSCRPKYC
jgi:hypothetical protein